MSDKKVQKFKKKIVSIVYPCGKEDKIILCLMDKKNRPSTLEINPDHKYWKKFSKLKVGDIIPFRRTLKEELA